MTTRLKLSERWTRYLLSQPESGMGYQRVAVRLKDGRTIRPVIVLNAELLEAPETAGIEAGNIVDITVER